MAKAKRPYGVNFSEKETEQLITLYQEGYNATEISKLLGCDRSTVYRVALRHGLRDKAGEWSPISKDKEAEIIELYTYTDMYIKDIREKVGVSQDAFDRVLRDYQPRRIGYSTEFYNSLIERYLASEVTMAEIKEMGIRHEQFYYHLRRYQDEL